METIGLILSIIGAIVIAVFAYMLTHSIIFTIIVFIIGAGYLFGKWTEAGTPYDIRDIRNELKKK